MIRWLRERPLLPRVLAYAALAGLVFALSAGVGAVGALMWRGDLSLPEAEKSPLPEKGTTVRVQREETTGRQAEADYVGKVGDVQAASVDALLDSHEKLLRYDALTAEDVEKMRENQAVLQESADLVDRLDPPPGYEEHHQVFSSAVNELYQASRLAYGLAADPTVATQAAFDEYDGHVDSAAVRLRRSNEILAQDYKSIGDVREVSPLWLGASWEVFRG
jgi:hypothetical protein